jgi:hypothetical protein
MSPSADKTLWLIGSGKRRPVASEVRAEANEFLQVGAAQPVAKVAVEREARQADERFVRCNNNLKNAPLARTEIKNSS